MMWALKFHMEEIERMFRLMHQAALCYRYTCICIRMYNVHVHVPACLLDILDCYIFCYLNLALSAVLRVEESTVGYTLLCSHRHYSSSSFPSF